MTGLFWKPSVFAYLPGRRHRSYGSGLPVVVSWYVYPVLCATTTLLPQHLMAASPQGIWKFLGFGHQDYITARWLGECGLGAKSRMQGLWESLFTSMDGHWFPWSFFLLFLTFFFQSYLLSFNFLTKDNKKRETVWKPETPLSVT